MIKLMVEDYCQECKGFDPVAVTSILMNEGGDDATVTQVCCRQRELCANVARRYKEKATTEKRMVPMQ